MKLSQAGEARVRGYLFILGRSLRSFLPKETVQDALREMESHIRERLDLEAGMPNEDAALERVLDAVGSPLRVAQAYAAEIAIEEAVSTGRLVAIARSVWHLASTTVVGFFAGLGFLVGYTTAVAFLAVAVLKPIFPENVGLFYGHGLSLGFVHTEELLRTGMRPHGGYWVIPLCLGAGLGTLVATHRAARRFLAWWRDRREPHAPTS